MSSGNAQLNTTNGLIFHPEHGWVLDHQSNPLYGWPMKKVLSKNPYNIPKNDLYGRLYFYIVERMKVFIRALKTGKIKFFLYCKDAKDLME
jgi:hypothetical protein